MNKDLQCPLCGEWQQVDHDDGMGYDQDVMHNQECSDCGNIFGFKTYISFSYDPVKTDCLNDGNHKWKLSHTYPRKFSQMYCDFCEERRDLTEEEKQSLS